MLNDKNVKNEAKRALALKGYGSSSHVEVLNTFNPELEPKDTESAIKSKLIELLTQIKSFKFVAAFF